jgi:UDP-N-acetylglucosamine/UDP-N-acetylgalactosamine 4-epimerase
MFNKPYHNIELSRHSFLVTGGAGFIGSNLVEYLLAFGAKKVVVLDNLSNGFYKNIEGFLDHPSFSFIEGDIRDLNICKSSVQGIDIVFHEAALGSVPRSIKDPISTTEVNINGFINILVAAKEAGVKRIVYAASSSTYGDSKILPKQEDVIGNPLSPYAITKYVNELYAENFQNIYGLYCVGLRYFNVFGPRQDPRGAYAAVIPLFIDAIIENKAPVIFGNGEQTRDFTYIDNVVQANIKAAFADLSNINKRIYNVACGERISINQLFYTLKDSSNSNLVPQYIPERLGDVKDSLADISKARKELGYQPEIFNKEGLIKTYQWFQENQDFIKIRK